MDRPVGSKIDNVYFALRFKELTNTVNEKKKHDKNS
jgi:hypothetical protein